jgi:signal transduction histidine kinase
MLGAAQLDDRGAWRFFLLLALAVVLPSSALLFFTNDAARSQEQAARRSVDEAYRGQLRFLQQRVDSEWKARIAATERAAAAGAPSSLPAALKESGADALFFLDEAGSLSYPSLAPKMRGVAPLTDAELIAARVLGRRLDRSAAIAAYQRLAQSAQDPAIRANAAEGLVRCLSRAGRKEDALAAIAKYFASRDAERTVDFDGRSIAADERLLALRLMKPTDARYMPAAQRLAELLGSYQDVPIPSAQRVFLADELHALAPNLALPASVSAERLCQFYLDAETPRPGMLSLQPSAMPDLWKVTTPNHRVIALYRTRTLRTALESVLAEESTSHAAAFRVAPPTQAMAGDAVAAGDLLPGWQIGFTLIDPDLAAHAARRRTATYLWAGYLAIAAIVAAGLLLGQAVRRQMRLARLKTDLVTTVSHELKTPLTSLRLLVETLLEEAVPPPTAREYLKMIAGENLRLTRLVDNFLTFSRIERSRQRFDFTRIRPAEVVESAVLSLRERVRAGACRLEVEVSPDLPVLRADHDALVTVLVNLLDNACKYAPTDTEIKVSAYLENGRVVFAVADNGIGIAPREHKKIFHRFYQVDRRLARETGGCGLGLSIVDFIVRAHGGSVAVQSTPGAGSTFSVFLPYDPMEKLAGA